MTIALISVLFLGWLLASTIGTIAYFAIGELVTYYPKFIKS